MEETLARASRYRNAGASGIFVPGLVDADGIRAVASGIDLPLNLMARPNLPAGAELAKLGVRRLSAGSGIAEAVFGRAAELAGSFIRTGLSSPLSEGAMPYRDINALMSGR